VDDDKVIADAPSSMKEIKDNQDPDQLGLNPVALGNRLLGNTRNLQHRCVTKS
jgi:hypothetical protein